MITADIIGPVVMDGIRLYLAALSVDGNTILASPDIQMLRQTAGSVAALCAEGDRRQPRRHIATSFTYIYLIHRMLI